jgi:thiamine kinase-like enzyme
VLCHNDANIDNLVIRQTPSGQELVMFDIQWTGAAGVGTELGQILCHVPMKAEGQTREQIEARVIDEYVKELNVDGIVVTREQVEFGYNASAALRQFHFALALLAEDLADLLDSESDTEIRAKVATFVDNNRGGPLPRLAARAYELTSALK